MDWLHRRLQAPVDPRAIEKPKMMKAKGMRVKGQAVVVEPEMLWALESIFPALAAKRDRRWQQCEGRILFGLDMADSFICRDQCLWSCSRR